MQTCHKWRIMNTKIRWVHFLSIFTCLHLSALSDLFFPNWSFLRWGGRLGLRFGFTCWGSKWLVCKQWRRGWGWGRRFGGEEGHGKIWFHCGRKKKWFKCKRILIFFYCCVGTGVFHTKREGGGKEGSGFTCTRLLSHYRNDEHRGEG